jgi:hypothetical protein
MVTATGTYGSETVTLSASPASTASTGPFNGVVIADSSAGVAAGQLTAFETY